MADIFRIVARDAKSRARAGSVQTAHGSFETPIFMPVGTRGTVKSLSPEEVAAHRGQIILGNTYHLYLLPGHELIARRGGLHRFMNWPGPILTDSGGFQVFSLIYGSIADEIKGRRPQHGELQPDMVKVTDDGVIFRSYIDGSEHMFTPERSIEIQHHIGADIVLCFDELPPYRAGYDYTARSMEQRTHPWEQRCLAYHQQHYPPDATTLPQQLLFGIVHGGVFPDLRRQSAELLGGLPFDGMCIGGSLGATKAQMYEVVDMTVPFMPDNRARHLLGVGDVDDLIEQTARGIDMFDCVSPTRLGRHGTALIRDRERNWKLNVTNASLREEDLPLDAWCDCYTCQHYSRAYIHYLFRAKELFGIRLVSLHNVAFLLKLTSEMRASIVAGTFPAFYAAWLGKPLPAALSPAAS